MSLTQDQIRQYNEEGYLVFEALIQGDKLLHYKSVLDELVHQSESLTQSKDGFNLQPDKEGALIHGRLFKIQGVCVEEPRILELASEAVILDLIESLIGANLHVFGSKFFPMLPEGGTSTGWHQDNHYFGTNSEQVVTCGIYLEDTDRENGCLQIVPRSHVGGVLVEHKRGKGEYDHGEWAEIDESKAIDVICPGGTVMIFSANLLHAAHVNRSVRTRYSTAWHYIPADMELEQFPFPAYKDRHSVRGD